MGLVLVRLERLDAESARLWLGLGTGGWDLAAADDLLAAGVLAGDEVAVLLVAEVVAGVRAGAVVRDVRDEPRVEVLEVLVVVVVAESGPLPVVTDGPSLGFLECLVGAGDEEEDEAER